MPESPRKLTTALNIDASEPLQCDSLPPCEYCGREGTREFACPLQILGHRHAIPAAGLMLCASCRTCTSCGKEVHVLDVYGCGICLNCGDYCAHCQQMHKMSQFQCTVGGDLRILCTNVCSGCLEKRVTVKHPQLNHWLCRDCVDAKRNGRLRDDDHERVALDFHPESWQAMRKQFESD